LTEPIESIERERLGADASAWRQRNLGGWGGLLPRYRQAAGA
jgi:hypothetical protein